MSNISADISKIRKCSKRHKIWLIDNGWWVIKAQKILFNLLEIFGSLKFIIILELKEFVI